MQSRPQLASGLLTFVSVLLSDMQAFSMSRCTGTVHKKQLNNPNAKTCKEPCTPSELTKRRVTSRCGGVASAFSIVINVACSVTIISPSEDLHEQPEGFLGKPAAGFTGCRLCRRAPKLDDSMIRGVEERMQLIFADLADQDSPNELFFGLGVLRCWPARGLLWRPVRDVCRFS